MEYIVSIFFINYIFLEEQVMKIVHMVHLLYNIF